MRFDEAFANAAHIPGGSGFPGVWAARAAAFRAGQSGRAGLGLRYGSAGRNWFDLFLPEAAPPLGLMVFVHGGYWLAFGPRDFSHLAAGALARGWAVAMPGYTLAPTARLAEIRAEAGRAISAMAGLVEGPLVLTGHSAGGQIVARLACADGGLPEPVAARIRRVVPISPLGDLRPLIETGMNADLRLDAAEARAESPALWPLRPGLGAHVWVGADERPRFRDQARRLGNGWSCPVTAEPARHHFDVIEGLERPGSALMAVLLG